MSKFKTKTLVMIVNGRRIEHKYTYGKNVSLHYRYIVRLAGRDPDKFWTVTYAFSACQGEVLPGEVVSVPEDEIPIFNVTDTSAA